MIHKTDGTTFILLKDDCDKESPLMDWIENNNATPFLNCHHICAWAGKTVYTDIWL